MTVRRPTNVSPDDPLVPAVDAAGQPAAVLDDPGCYLVALPERLTLPWVLGLTLPPAPRPVLLWGATSSSAPPTALQALACRLVGRRVTFMHVGVAALELIEHLIQPRPTPWWLRQAPPAGPGWSPSRCKSSTRTTARRSAPSCSTGGAACQRPGGGAHRLA